MTYGAFRLRISKLAPGLSGDLELIDGWINNVYQAILDRLPWKRTEAEFVIQSPLSYTTGTIAATQGSASIVGTGTVWTAGMNGLLLRMGNQDAYYSITVLTATTATLDRPFEGVTDAALVYRIDQPVFVMPANCRIIRAVAPMHGGLKPLELITPGDLDRRCISRNEYGTPRYAVPHWDNFSDPPRMQLELFPIPDCPNTAQEIPSWAVDYIFDPATVDDGSTSASLLPWVRPGALEEGVMAKVRRHSGDHQGAREHKKEYEELVLVMATINAAQRGPQEIRLAPELRRQTGKFHEQPFSKDFGENISED